MPIGTIDGELIAAQRRDAHARNARTRTALFAAPTPYTIDAGDVLQITVWDHPELVAAQGNPGSQQVRPADPPAGFVVDQGGNLAFPYVGELHVAGMDTSEIQAALRARLSKWFVAPQVTVRVASYRANRVYIDGGVHSLGAQPVNDTPMTLLEAVTRAGGFTADADQSRIALVRSGAAYPIDLPALIDERVDSLCLALSLAGVAVAMFVSIGAPARGACLTRIDMKGLQFGVTNFLSGGIALVTVPAAKAMCGASFAGMLSLFASVTAVGNLLPRAISIAQLPDLVKRKKDNAPLGAVLSKMRRNIDLSNLIVFFANLVIVAGLTYRHGFDGGSAYGVLAAGVLLALQCSAGVIGVVSSNVMMVFEKSAVTARINIGTSMLFAALLGGSVAVGGETGFFLMLASAVIVTLIRNGIVAMVARQVCAEHANAIGSARVAQMPPAPVASGARR